jgi:hypothetical protein
LQNFLKGNLNIDSLKRDLMNQAGEVVMGAAKEFIGQAINEMFIKKEAPSKRVLPSIQNMKIVSPVLAQSRMSLMLHDKKQLFSAMTLKFSKHAHNSRRARTKITIPMAN